ncbi:MAG: divergent polysaccharide deacetylase family protein [Methanococcoides sp.]|nr:divergent polysaccharide deacetylase family protein [Methanococcoides sp.]
MFLYSRFDQAVSDTKPFFIESLTTSESLCKPSARLLQLPFAQRDVFIDHFQEPDFIRKQIKLLIRIADKHGEAIGIAHPHIITYNILRELLPELQKKFTCPCIKDRAYSLIG